MRSTARSTHGPSESRCNLHRLQQSIQTTERGEGYVPIIGQDITDPLSEELYLRGAKFKSCSTGKIRDEKCMKEAIAVLQKLNNMMEGTPFLTNVTEGYDVTDYQLTDNLSQDALNQSTQPSLRTFYCGDRLQRFNKPARSRSLVHQCIMSSESKPGQNVCRYCDCNMGKRHIPRMRMKLLKCQRIPQMLKDMLMEEINEVKERVQPCTIPDAAYDSQSKYTDDEESGRVTPYLAAGSASGTRSGSRNRRGMSSEGETSRSRGTASTGVVRVGGICFNADSKYVCGDNDARVALQRMMELIVLEGLPFRIFDRRHGRQSAFTAFCLALRPGFGPYIPSSSAIGGRMLNTFYDDTKKSVTEKINVGLNNGYGTLLFDGWEDVNSMPVVNVLLRTETASKSGQTTFF